MNDITQTLSGFPIPVGYRLKFECNDCGPEGTLTINVLYEVHGKFKQMQSVTHFDGEDGVSYRIYLDVYDCKILHISGVVGGNKSLNRNHYLRCTIEKQQGSGGSLHLNQLFNVPLRGRNLASWPVINQQYDSYQDGVPHLFTIEPGVSDYYFDIPTNYCFVPTSFFVKITLSAEVGNRQLRIIWYDDTVDFYNYQINENLVASTTYYIYGYESNPIDPFNIVSYIYIKLPLFKLNDDHRIRILIFDDLVGDVIDIIKIFGYLDFN